MNRFFRSALVVSLFAVLLAQCLFLSWHTGQTTDEAAYSGTGYPNVRFQDYHFIGEHPPLAMQLGALPLLFLKPHFPLKDPVYIDNSATEIDISKTGLKFLYQKGNDPQLLLFWQRLPIIFLTLLLGFGLFIWSQQLFGFGGGVLSLLLYVFCPDLVAHGSLYTTDLAVAAFFFLTFFWLHRFFSSYAISDALGAGLCAGLALMSKISAITLLPILFLIFSCAVFLCGEDSNSRPKLTRRSELLILLTVFIMLIFTLTHKQMFVIGGGIFLLGVTLLGRDLSQAKLPAWVRYCLIVVVAIGWAVLFMMAFKLLKKFAPIHVLAFTGWGLLLLVINFFLLVRKDSEEGTYFAKIFALIWALAFVVIIFSFLDFPHTLLRFKPFAHFPRLLQVSLSHTAGGHAICTDNSFVSCDWRYFITALIVKTPLWSLILFGVGVLGLFRAKLSKMNLLLVSLPPIVFLGIASLLNHINIGTRHVLAVYPFMFLIAGSVVPLTLSFQKKLIRVISVTAVFGLAVFSGISVSKNFPYYLSYAAHWVGGMEDRAKVLADSNFNWGQDNRLLADYVRTQGIVSFKISDFPAINGPAFDYYKVNWSLMDLEDFSNPSSGFYVLDIASYVRQQSHDSFFKGKTPSAKIGSTFYLFEVKRS